MTRVVVPAVCAAGTATFTVDGVRAYLKTTFPATLVYANTATPTLRLITCGGIFDYTTKDYLSNTVVYATLTSTHQQ